MKLKHLESALEQVDVFGEPKVELEQYPTSAHIAARMLFTAQSVYDDIEGKRVADLGCGAGVLSIAAALMGCQSCTSFDVDCGALEIARENVEGFELEDTITLVEADVKHLDQLTAYRDRPCFDTIVTNPPFGTREKGIDLVFVKTAIDLASRAVYSLHKTSTRAHVLKKAESWGIKASVVAQLRYDIPRMYKFHKDISRDIEVDFIRFQVGNETA